jgi:hypothetical protein
MNEGQLKIKILLIQVMDWSLLIAALSVGAYTIFYAEYVELMAIASFMALYLVHVFWQLSLNKIAALRVELEILQKKQRKGY